MNKVVERLINLSAFLRGAGRPVTAREIWERVDGYSQQSWESFKRMFERDKEALLLIGMPLEYQGVDSLEVEHGYEFSSPLPPVDLTDEEHAALAIALQMVHVGGDATGPFALFKLGGLPMMEAVTPPIAYLTMDYDMYERIFRAVREHRRVQFDYRGKQRIIEPYGMVVSRGHWYVVGPEDQQSDTKTFRISRIENLKVSNKPDSFTRPPGVSIYEVDKFGRWDQGDEQVLAQVRWDEQMAWFAVRNLPEVAGMEEHPDGGVVTTIKVADTESFLDWILGFGLMVEILAPAHLREAFVKMVKGES